MFEIDSLKITLEMVNLIAEVDEFKGAWQHLSKLAPARLLELKKVARIASVGSSSRLEGAQLSDIQIEALLSRVDKEALQTHDEQEAAGHAFLYEQICMHYPSIPLTEHALKHLHTMLLQYTKKHERHRGVYKKIPIETPDKIQALISWTNKAFAQKHLHPLLIIGIFTFIFLTIDPFQDGNGRLSRMLATLLMLKNGYAYVVYGSIESVIEAHKEHYSLALHMQDQPPEWDAWLLFFLRCLQEQKQHLEAKLAREKKLLERLPSLPQQISSLLAAHGRLRISEMATLTKANRNTLKKALAAYVQEGHIARNGRGKSTWYSVSLLPGTAPSFDDGT